MSVLTESEREVVDAIRNVFGKVIDSPTIMELVSIIDRICAEVKKQTGEADVWCGRWSKYATRWEKSTRTIRRLRRRWQWEKRRAATHFMEEGVVATLWDDLDREMAERDALAARCARQRRAIYRLVIRTQKAKAAMIAMCQDGRGAKALGCMHASHRLRARLAKLEEERDGR
jgi:hypothetical protein